MRRIGKRSYTSMLDQYAREGLKALEEATPVDTGLTARSWSYEITESEGKVKITWSNSNTVDGISVAVLIQYGHATGGGGYVQGRDFINPAIRPIFDKIAESAWREVTK